MTIKFLKAHNGDSILISFKEGVQPRNILIDGGISKTYLNPKNAKGKPEAGELKKEIELLREKNEIIDLLVLTHVDDDHIGGILKWFGKDELAYEMVGKVWFNSGKLIAEHFKQEAPEENELILDTSNITLTSIAQGVKFETYLLNHQLWERKLIMSQQCIQLFGIDFRILSPNEDKLKALLGKWEKEKPILQTSGGENDYGKSLLMHIADDQFAEDNAIHNGSSIAFVMSYQSRNMLFLADAHPSVIAASLAQLGYSKNDPLKAEFVKVSHHGSKSNNSVEMLEMIDSTKYIISTNGGKHHHPNKQFLARLIHLRPDCEIYFNYPSQLEGNRIFSKQDQIDFPNFKPLITFGNEFTIE